MVLEKSKLTTGENTKQPVYEVIKRQDITAAFRDALTEANAGIVQQLNEIANLYAAIANPALWTWDYGSRWDYDQWW